jgi:CheY-like chemotaxis protein
MKLLEILWVEDESIAGLVEYKVHLETTDDFKLTVVESADAAEKIIRKEGEKFDVILIDTRLPPGLSERWFAEYRESDQLGIKLLINILTDPATKYLKDRIGITTIERWKDIKKLFPDEEDFFDKRHFLHKIEADTPEMLEQFIRDIYVQNIS